MQINTLFCTNLHKFGVFQTSKSVMQPFVPHISHSSNKCDIQCTPDNSLPCTVLETILCSYTLPCFQNAAFMSPVKELYISSYSAWMLNYKYYQSE